uniref:Uncharacterized protein n=1 Tax=Acrobeloides nanus TaxID=290746 RepID=A0A914C9V5_9BILA
MSEIDHHIGYAYCSSCAVKSVFLNRNCKLEAYEGENFTGFHIHYNTSGKHELYVSNEINSIRSCECNFNETETLQNIDEVETILTLDDLKTESVETCSNWNPFFIGLFIGIMFFVSITGLYILRNSILALFRRFPYRISVVRHIHLKHKVDDVNNTIASFQDLMKSYDA